MTAQSSELPQQRPRPKIVRWYVGVAIILFNTLIFFVVLNLVIWAGLKFHRRNQRPAYLTHSDAFYRKVYAPMPDDEWKELVREIKDRPFAFTPYEMFGEGAYHGKYLNISEQGYRLVPDQGPWPMDPKNFNVLAFGGSTMFGYAVADDKTVPAYVQALMQKAGGRRVCIYNFGRRAYYSTQERILFEQLLRDGAKPNLAIFMDGLNDFLFAVEPSFLQQSHDEMLSPVSDGTRLLEIWRSLPAGELTQMISKKIMPAPKLPQPDWKVIDPVAIDRYVWNKSAIEAICASQSIPVVFVYQPTPTYHYGQTLNQHEWETPGDQCVVQGYPLMAEYVKDHKMGDNFLWLADIQKPGTDLLYVDKWHYSPDFSQQIAAEICKFLEKRNELPAP